MSSARLFRLSGLALLIGDLLVILFTVIGTLLFPGNAPTNALWVPVQLLGLIGFTLTFLAALILGVGGGIIFSFILP